MAWDAATLRGIIDNIAKNVKLLITTRGSDTTADTVLYHITQNQTRIDGIGDADYEKYLELANDKARIEAAALPYIVYAGLARTLADTIRTNEEQSLEDEWDEKADGESVGNKRIPAYFADLLKGNLTPALVFPPDNITMGDWDVTGGGTFTDGEEINTVKYGGAWLKAVVTAVFDVSTTFTVQGLDAAGNPWESDEFTITDSNIIGDEITINNKTGLEETYCANVTGITKTSGSPTTGSFDVKSRDDRSLSA